MTASPTILVCFAVREEAKYFSTPDDIGAHVAVVVTGIGRKNAARVLEQHLAHSRPDLVLTCGYAGGLRPGLAVGTILHDADAEAGVSALLSELGASAGSFCCADRVATTADEKQRLRERTGADAVEMESGIIRQICRERHVPSATIRAISDVAEEDLPLDFTALINEAGTVKYTKLALALLSAPGKVPGLIRLQRQTRLAGQNLGGVLRELLRRKGGLRR